MLLLNLISNLVTFDVGQRCQAEMYIDCFSSNVIAGPRHPARVPFSQDG